MNWLEIAFRRFFKRRDLDRELNEELASHIDMEVESRVQAGETQETARLKAVKEFGNMGLVAEVTRDQWGLTWLEQAIQDARYALRAFARVPLFSIIVILTLAMGIGSSTTIFSLLDGILLRALPFPDSNRLVMLWELPPNTQKPNVVNLKNFVAWKERNHSFESMAAFLRLPLNIHTDQGSEQVPGLAVTADFFQTFGIPPLLGRTFRPDEYWRDEPNEVVLSFNAWQRLFGGRSNVVGKTISIDGSYHEIIGVMPRGFALPNSKDELYVPQAILQNDGRNYSVIARLRSGISADVAKGEMATLASQTALEHVELDSGWSATAVPLLEQAVGPVRPILVMLFVVVGLLLLLACANVANLLLMKAAGREREISVRMALGASRHRILRQLLIENSLLAACGGLLGVALAAVALDLLKTSLPVSLNIPRLNEVTLSIPVLIYSAAASILSSLFFGLAPALQCLKRNLTQDLRSSTRSVTGGHKARNAFVVMELALALILVSAAGLVIRSFLHLVNVNTGFHAENVLTVHMLLLPSQDDQRHAQVVREMLERVRNLPGVVAAGSIGILPMQDTNSGTYYYRADRPDPLPSARPEGDVSIITPGYFEALRIPMIRGRAFDEDDRAGHPLVAVLNQSAARMLFENEDAIGKRVKIEWTRDDVVTIIGVVADIRHEAVNSSPDPCIFMPNEQQPFPFTSLVVRTAGDPALLEQAIREQIEVIDPDQGIAQIKLMRQMVSDSIATPRLEAQVLGVFGVIALTLASLGLYGLIAFSVTQRSREIGIRVALGASKTAILRMIVGDGIRLATVGVLVGLVGFVGLTQFLRSLLFEVKPTDPATLISVICTLLMVSLLACLVPAQRATMADPAAILRDE